MSFHSLRHAAASRLIEAGLSPTVVSKVLGHKNPHVTLTVYAHLFNRQQSDEQVRAAMGGGFL